MQLGLPLTEVWKKHHARISHKALFTQISEHITNTLEGLQSTKRVFNPHIISYFALWTSALTIEVPHFYEGQIKEAKHGRVVKPDPTPTLNFYKTHSVSVS